MSTPEEIAEESIQFFDWLSSEKYTAKEIADSTGYSLKTVYNRVNQGREIIEEQIRKTGRKYLADIWKKYEYVWEEAKTEWLASKNPKFLAEMRAVLEAWRKMVSVDAPALAPVNENGQAVPQTLVMIFDESQYKEKELEIARQDAIEGNFTVTENSTKVPLTISAPDDKLSA